MKNKNFYKIGMIYFIAMICVAVIFMLGYFQVFQSDIISSCLIQLVVMCAIPLFMYTVLVSKNVKTSFADFGFKKVSFKTIVIAVLIGIVLYFLNTFVATAFGNIIFLLGYENLATATQVNLDYEFLIKDFVFTAVMPGFFEEFLHRGMLLLAGKKASKNPRYCLIVSSILFGLMHLNINQFFYASILGVLMGFVALKADSVFPTMIIHFMNNFLNSYFVYGVYLNWPLAKFVNSFRQLIFANPLISILAITIGVCLLILLYVYLVKIIANERVKRDMKKLINALELNKLDLTEAQEKVNQANIMLQQINSNEFGKIKNQSKFNFADNVFIISSYVLGGLVTLFSFIGGLI